MAETQGVPAGTGVATQSDGTVPELDAPVPSHRPAHHPIHRTPTRTLCGRLCPTGDLQAQKTSQGLGCVLFEPKYGFSNPKLWGHY